ncbi:hypothetical protein BB558_003543, partial [Smittium angustum]
MLIRQKVVPGTPWFQKTTSITISNSRMDFIGNKVGNANNTNTGAGQPDKSIIWNAPELKAKTVSNAILMHTQLKWDAFNVTKVKQQDGNWHHEMRSIKGIKEELNEYLSQKNPSIIALQKTWLTKKSNRWYIPGYTCAEGKSSIKKEGMGLLIEVRSNYKLGITELKNSTQWMASKEYGAF